MAGGAGSSLIVNNVLFRDNPCLGQILGIDIILPKSD